MEHSPFLKTLTETGSSVTDDLGMVQNDPLKSVICLGHHDSDVSWYQVIVSSAFISVTFRLLLRISVDEERLQRHMLCLGFPVSRLRNLEDASLDLLPIEGFEPWVSSDLVQNPIQETVDPPRYCRIAVAVVIMGDLNAVYAVEAAHRRQLLSVGSLQIRTMLIPGFAYHRSATIGNVDDLVISGNGSLFPNAFEG